MLEIPPPTLAVVPPPLRRVPGGATMPDVDDDTLGAIAHTLYGLRPEEFTRARDEEARRARAAGDRQGAQAVAALRRPSLAAWLVNVLVRERPDEVEQLLALGAALAAAQNGLAGDEVRVLGRQRQQLLAAVGRQARALARDLGHPVSEEVGQEVEQTLGAAMVDPRVAEAVRSGRLTSPASYAGLGLPETDPSPRPRLVTVPGEERAGPERAGPGRAGAGAADAAAPATARITGGGDQGSAAPREHAQRERRDRERLERERVEQERVERERVERERRAAALAQAREEEREAREALTAALGTARAAQARLDDAEHAEAAARRRVEDLQAQMRRAEAELATAAKEERALRRERDAAARVADLAERAAGRARQRVEQLDQVPSPPPQA